LPDVAETAEVRSLLSGLQREELPKDIAALCAEGTKQNDAVESALAGLSAPLAALNEARSRRDAAIPDWEKHHRRLEDASKVVYRDEAGRVRGAVRRAGCGADAHAAEGAEGEGQAGCAGGRGCRSGCEEEEGESEAPARALSDAGARRRSRIE
jgi:hypothetical protein